MLNSAAMAAKKARRRSTTRSGPNISNAQRHTSVVLLRLAPESATRLRTLARQLGTTLAETVGRAVDLLDAQERKGGAR